MRETPSQTAGPYVHIGCVPNAAGFGGVWERDLGASMLRDGASGERIVIEGTVADGMGAPVRDAMVEIWQADASGLFAGQEGADPGFLGFGRCACAWEDGSFRFETIRPGRVPWADGRLQAPHVTVWIVARGINTGLHTRLYFEGDPANAEDPLLAAVQPPERRETLMARRAGEAWRFDIRLQGAGETVFLDM